jgi:magnesium-transporting ATPase (P-type)
MTKNKPLQKKTSGSLLTGSLIIAFMLFVPYAFYLYNYFPNEKIYETSFFTFESKGYESVNTFMWLLFSKFVPLVLLLIWFTTCKQWWYYSIAIPISVYVFQLIGILNDDLLFMDQYEFIYSLPITLIILTILYFIRSKINVYLKAMDIKKEMDEVMDRPFVKKE